MRAILSILLAVVLCACETTGNLSARKPLTDTRVEAVIEYNEANQAVRTYRPEAGTVRFDRVTDAVKFKDAEFGVEIVLESYRIIRK